MTEKTKERCFALVPAAGTGSRMASGYPKQYMDLLGKPVLSYSVEAFLACPEIEKVFIALAPGDTIFESMPFSFRGDPRAEALYCGGATRRETVLNALIAASAVSGADWVLVHDAARPGLTPDLVRKLILSVRGTDGGLLALPISDTVKRLSGGRVETVPRTGLWLAQTPQMFKAGFLRKVLARFQDVTDEAGAAEAAGVSPVLVVGSHFNMKITQPADLAFLEALLGARDRKGGAE